MSARTLIPAVLLSILIAACSNPASKSSVVIAPPVEASEADASQRVAEARRASRETKTRKPRVVGVLETAQTSVAVSNGADKDIEPAVTAFKIGTTDHTTVAFIKITAEAAPLRARIYSTSTTNLNSFPAPLQAPIPSSPLAGTYLNSADPYVAANPYNAGPGPLRAYMIGLAYNMLNDAAATHPNGGIVIWRSDNGGGTWSGSTIIAETALPRVYDKPHLAVSWNTASFDGHGPTVGNVYAVWVDVDNDNPQSGNHIRFSRSLDGGVTWSASQILASGFVHAPQVVVPPNTGRIFVLYGRYQANSRVNSIEMVRSLDVGQNWTSLTALTGTAMFGPGMDALVGVDPNTNQVRTINARSVFQARYNGTAGIQVIWHGEDPLNPGTADIYYAAYTTAWTAIRNLTPQAAGDQFLPSFDYDTQRNAVVTWLDRREHTGYNLYYKPYFMKISTSGATLQAPAPLSSAVSDPSQYTALGRSIGEYNDTWYYNYGVGNRWVTVWPRIHGPSNGDIYATQITP